MDRLAKDGMDAYSAYDGEPRQCFMCAWCVRDPKAMGKAGERAFCANEYRWEFVGAADDAWECGEFEYDN